MNSSWIHIISQYHTRRFTNPDKCRALAILWSSCFPFIYNFISAKLKGYLSFNARKKLKSYHIGSEACKYLQWSLVMLNNYPIVLFYHDTLFCYTYVNLRFFCKRKGIEIKHYNCIVYYYITICQLRHQFTPFVCSNGLRVYLVWLWSVEKKLWAVRCEKATVIYVLWKTYKLFG